MPLEDIAERTLTILLDLSSSTISAIENLGDFVPFLFGRVPQELAPAMFAKQAIELGTLTRYLDDNHVSRLLNTSRRANTVMSIICTCTNDLQPLLTLGLWKNAYRYLASTQHATQRAKSCLSLGNSILQCPSRTKGWTTVRYRGSSSAGGGVGIRLGMVQ